jgi:Ribbon-helix-helix protein, copG family.
MPKNKFDPTETAKKFLSNVEIVAAKEQETGEQYNRTDYIPEAKETGAKRAKGKDKKTGEETKQIGYYVTAGQDKRLSMLSIEYEQNKSYFVREALRMYFDYLDSVNK